MAEIAAVVAVIVSLIALWLANHALRSAQNTFGDIGKHLAKQVKDSQTEFSGQLNMAMKDVRDAERIMKGLESQQRETATNLNTLMQRMKVVEHELSSLTEALPPKYRKITEKRSSGGGV